MIAASIATHFTARLSVQRQAAMGTPATGQTAMMNKLTLYIFPLGVLVFGGGFPVGLLLYWLSNNGWTLAQQHFVFKRMDREEAAEKEQAIQNRNALAPKPGQKPVRKRPTATPAKDIDQVEDAVPETVEDAVPQQDAKPQAANKPRPGQKPNRDPRRAVKPTVPNPAGKNGAARPAAKNSSGTTSDGSSANGKATTSPEIPGLISDRPRRRKQDRKRG
jgi:YidC/Oxa1 family membrane protein insertase